jgi:hypothetical protein
MTHKQIEQALDQNLDDLKVRNPQKYQQIERKLRLLEIESGFAVAQSPPGIRSMERSK